MWSPSRTRSLELRGIRAGSLSKATAGVGARIQAQAGAMSMESTGSVGWEGMRQAAHVQN